MNEYDAKEMLKKYGIKVPNGALVENLDDLEKLNLKYPLVAKVASEKILHKTDVGGVILNIGSREELKNAVKNLMDKFHAPVLVEEMLHGGVEIIVGVTKDPSFGHVIMFGLGGIFTEILRDVTFRVIPIGRKDAEMMLSEIKGRKILEGYRGTKVDRESIIELLLRISELVEENPDIEGIDLNPVLAREKDCVVLDAKIIR
ncbi:ATP-grasp domain protein [Aciduliprofundum sp. MAR08-339]|uniref:acetate--CoA ligase family protein n=1 Tax=Aciduliprofundum sp. (strain MAR08-339) TaxID=673860 RepID=UPI0002A4C6F6|nr:ATP-grasp domain protein [Aciduliprofundum sp. MAR08-339]